MMVALFCYGFFLHMFFFINADAQNALTSLSLSFAHTFSLYTDSILIGGSKSSN